MNEVKKRGGAWLGVGRVLGKKPTPPLEVDESAVMTLQEVADYLNCHYGTARALALRGDIPSFKLGGHRRFLKSEVDEWIAKGGGRRPSEELAVKPKRKPRPRSPGARRK